MKKVNLTLICLFVCLISLSAQSLPQLGKNSTDEVLKAMTLDEKVSLLIGTGMAGFSGNNAVVGSTQDLVPGSAGTTMAIERLGIPALVLADGPAGLRISPKREGSDKTYYCTAFPVATLLSSTWNTDLVQQVGAAMGKEVLEYGCDVLLAPALNIHRNPLCGRNFEYYSEDPVLAGKMTVAMVKGVQSNGVGTSIKHFAANNQETNRTGNDARMSERALREIYLKGFEIAVKEANPWTIMSSYNYINGTYTSESRGLLTDILRDEWGFKGIVMTDWFGGRNASAQVYAGNDLLMPGRSDQKKTIMDALQTGSLDVSYVDTNVKRILDLILQSSHFKGYNFSNSPDLKAHAAITRNSASEGMILLKNEGSVLPLNKKIKKVVAFGVTSYDFIAGGTGSGDVNEAYTVSLVDGFANAGFKLDKEVQKIYTDYISVEKEKNKPDPKDRLAAFMNQKRAGELLPADDLLKAKAKTSDIAVITIGRSSGEFKDRLPVDDFTLTAEELQLIKNVTGAFHAEAKKVVVILNLGGVIETSTWKDIPDAILLAWQAGQEGGNSVVDIISGKVNPSGKLTMTFPVKLEDVASSKNFPMEPVDLKSMISFMTGESKAVQEPKRNVDYTIYEEGIYVGYRYFDTFEVPVSYPFGFGMSYTSFDYSDLKVQTDNGLYTVNCKVTNVGNKAGKEAVQLYVSAPGKTMNKPSKELKAFAKTALLKPGDSEILTLKFAVNDLTSFCDASTSWMLESGMYKILIGASASDIRLSQPVEIKEGGCIEKVHHVLYPVINEIK